MRGRGTVTYMLYELARTFSLIFNYCLGRDFVLLVFLFETVFWAISLFLFFFKHFISYLY